MYYKRLTESLHDRGILIPENQDVYNFIKTQDKDYYLSTYKYNEEQKKQFEDTGTISGITDVVTDKLWWDFDSEFEPEQAKLSTVRLVEKLLETGIDKKDIAITFSGNKGFGVEVNLTETLIPKQVKEIAFELANGLPHFDVKMYNASRIFRVLHTRHQKTGLYKTPLTYGQLKELSLDDIMDLAKEHVDYNEEFQWSSIPLPSSIVIKKAVETKTEQTIEVSEIDFSKKIKGWSNCKWALTQGYQIINGDRHEKLLCIVATSRALHFSKEQSYYTAKNADEQGVLRNGGTKASKEDIWQMVESVYSDHWKGGTFSCKDGKTPWLTSLCNSLGTHKCKREENTNFVEIDKAFFDFEVFAKDIEKNTIKTGISNLDEAVRFRTGQMVGILGAPSSGKTSLALEILENTSKQGLLSVFYSLDMSSSELFQKIAQRVTGYAEQDLFNILQTNPSKSEKIRQQVCDAYSNVKFCFDTGVSVENIQTAIDDFQNLHNKKVILLMLDYNELLSSPYSDSTASSGYNAGALKKLTNNNQLCTVSLLQPPKVVGDASDEISSYRSIKGSSLLEQCFSIVIGVFRPGFSPKNNSESDKFMIMNVLKNRLGKLCNLKFYWDGLRGRISELNEGDDEGQRELQELIDSKKMEKSSSGGMF